MVARGRLKGALQDIKGQDDEEQDHIVSSTTHTGNRGRPPKRIELVSYQQNASFLPCRGRPPKRFKKESQSNTSTELAPTDHKSFIMKLFDRSVDLAKYGENSALYPICRAWMLNQPRSNKLIKWVLCFHVFRQKCMLYLSFNSSFKLKQPEIPDLRLLQPSLVSEMKAGKITVINSMPACRKLCEIPRLPSEVKKEAKEEEGIADFNLDYVSTFEWLIMTISYKYLLYLVDVICPGLFIYKTFSFYIMEFKYYVTKSQLPCNRLKKWFSNDTKLCFLKYKCN